jgi:NSS family neurotransmitter:Na+ symporter
MALNEIQKQLLREVADLHEVPEGAYNIRANGESAARATTANINIVTKEDKPGIDIIIAPGTKKESVHIPVIISENGLKEMVYNDFYVGDDADIAADAMVIAFSDMAVSILSGVVMFSTMGGTGMLDSITASGIGTAFFVYPTAIVNLTGNGVINAIFGAIFYLMLITLAIDSAFSIVEGVSAAVSDKFHIKPKTVTIAVCLISGLISILFVTQAGLAWLDIVDNWTNQINLILIGILECIAIGWTFNLRKVIVEINKNTKRYKMPYFWFAASVKFISPVLLISLFIWNMITLFGINGGSYGDYPIWAQVVAGWAVSFLVFASGFIAKIVIARKKKKGFVEDEIVWKD